MIKIQEKTKRTWEWPLC